jgi:hypothetical protein
MSAPNPHYQTPQVGQIWRDDGDGYSYRVVAIADNGDAWCRHPNAHQGGHIVRRAWFIHWRLISYLNEDGKCVRVPPGPVVP